LMCVKLTRHDAG